MEQSAFRDMLSGLLFVVLGVGGLLMAQGFPIGEMRRIGPGAFPMLVCAMLTIVGAVLFLKSLPAALREPRGQAAPRLTRLMLAVGLIIGALMAFAFFINSLGLALTAFICVLGSYLGAVRLLQNRGGLLEGLVVAVCVSAFVVGVFVHGIGMSMRVWPT